MKEGEVTKISDKIINMIMNKFDTVKDNTVSYSENTERYEFDMFKVAQDRLSIIRDVNYLCGENGDIRFQRANALIGEDATRGGFSIVVNGSATDNIRRRRQGKIINSVSKDSERIQKILDDFLERTQLHIICTEHAKALLREGDLFLNVVIDLKSGTIQRIKRAPSLTMKKNINEYGEFIDLSKAYSQIDVDKIYQLSHCYAPSGSRTDFPLYQINHIRWLSDETKIYGTSQYAVSRKCYRILEEMERALAYRRIYRSVSKRNHKLEKASPAQIENYKRENLMIDKNGRPTKNAHLLTDYIGNVEVEALHDEADLDEIKDIELIENTLWVNLLTPKAIISGGQNINRDILKVQYPQYLHGLKTITDRLEYGDNSIYSGYRAIIDLQLLLSGVNPETVSYDIAWSKKTWESTMERVESIQNALGSKGGKQLISHEKAIQLVGEDFGIEDPSTMYQKILEENKINSDSSKPPKIINNKSKPLTDEHAVSSEKMDLFIESFKEIWNSFFYEVYNTVAKNKGLTDIESAISQVDKAFDYNLPQLLNHYLYFVSEAAYLGADTAEQIINNGNFKSISDDINDRARLGIARKDIYDDLLKESGKQIKRIEETTLNDIRKTLSDGFDEDIGWESLMDKIRPIIKNPVRAEMIATTELSWAYNRSTERVYKIGGANGLVWHGSDDLKTCDYCRSQIGNEYPIDKHPENPAHPRCRCTWLPAKLNKEVN